MNGARVLRFALVLLLAGGAYFVAQPWIACSAPLPGRGIYPDLASLCAFGSGNAAFDATGPGPMWWRVVIVVLYIVAAGWIAVTKRLSVSEFR